MGGNGLCFGSSADADGDGEAKRNEMNWNQS
jgi:hypothetical protein